MGEAEVEGLAAAHGEACEGAVVFVGERAVAGVDGGDDVVEEVFFEGGEGWGGFEDIAFGAVVFLGAAVGHDDDHGDGLAVGDEVIEEIARVGEALPFGFVAADAVEEVEDRVALGGGVAGRRVDVEFAGGADGFGFVGDEFEFSVGEGVADGVPALVGRREGGFIVCFEFGFAAGDAGFGGGSAFGSWCGVLGVGREGGEGGDDEGQGEGADHGVSGWMGGGHVMVSGDCFRVPVGADRGKAGFAVEGAREVSQASADFLERVRRHEVRVELTQSRRAASKPTSRPAASLRIHLWRRISSRSAR